MSKAQMEKIKNECTKLDVAETAMLAAYLMSTIHIDTPMGGEGCPHFEKVQRVCKYPKVVA